MRAHIRHGRKTDHPAGSRSQARDPAHEAAGREKQPLGVVYRAPRNKAERRRLPIWDEEFQNVDPMPMLKPFM